MYSKEKAADYSREWYNKHRERLLADPERKARNTRLAAEWRKNNPEKAMFSAAKARAKRNDMEFNISLEDIVIPEICPISLKSLFFTKGKPTENTPALDRIDNTQGYIKGNVQVISHKINRHKADLSYEEIERMYFYAKRSKNLT